MMTVSSQTAVQIKQLTVVVQADADAALKMLNTSIFCKVSAFVLTDFYASGEKVEVPFKEENGGTLSSLKAFYFQYIDGRDVCLGSIDITLPYKSQQIWPSDTLEGKPFTGINMNFIQAFAWLKTGRFVSLPHWEPGSFLYFMPTEEKTRVFTILNFKNDDRKDFTFKDEEINSSKWRLATYK